MSVATSGGNDSEKCGLGWECLFRSSLVKQLGLEDLGVRRERIDFHQLAKPANLSNSAVLRMLEEEQSSGRGQGLENTIQKMIKELGKRPSKKPPEWPPMSVTSSMPWQMWGVACIHGKSSPGLKRVAWPPPPEEGEFIVPIDESAQTQLPQSFTPSSPRLQRRASPPPPPSTITLRTSQPVRQAAAPVYVSQPITASVQGGLRSRGDQKWPPESVKQASEAENEARIALAKGPACRPRRVQKDYSTFFAQHALNSTYPGYKPPPGTQHYIEDGTSAL